MDKYYELATGNHSRLKSRLDRIFDNTREDVDVIAIINGIRVDANFFYITSYASGLFEYSAAFLFRDKHIEVLTGPLEEQAARQKDYVVHIQRKPSQRRSMLLRMLRGVRKIGYNSHGVDHSDYLTLQKQLRGKKLIDVSQAIEKTRIIKDPDEIDVIANAAKIISKVINNVPNLVRPRVSERELKAEIDYQIIKNGADSPSFESIVAFGGNSALPHYTPRKRKLRRGDTVLVDIGAKLNHYCSDITRTFFFGTANDKLNRMYNTVLQTQKNALKKMREGAKAREIHLLAQGIIDKTEFKGRFIHSLGHSLGLEVHDGYGRALSSNSKEVLKRNMVLTVEPGIYVPGFAGVRIEDDVVVEKNGCRILTSAPKELTVI